MYSDQFTIGVGMATRNDITGDAIQTKGVTDAYRDNYDLIWGKKTMTPAVQENVDEIGKCGCGRSPTGKCIGWHGLSEEEFRDALALYEDQKNKENQ
ncbi:MAG: hypothetical protein ACO22A_08690 [Schleiferiaceae bacterium]